MFQVRKIIQEEAINTFNDTFWIYLGFTDVVNLGNINNQFLLYYF